MTMGAKLDLRLIGYITTFENITKARVKDIFPDDGQLVFVVHSGEAGKAIGRAGYTIQKLQHMLKKKIKVIELSTSAEQFVKGAIDPLKVDAIEIKDKLLLLSVHDVSVKGKLIGRNGKNLKFLNELLKKYFDMRALVR
jgi:NusA-like KH domain protein